MALGGSGPLDCHEIRRVPRSEGFPVPLECEDVRRGLSGVPITRRTSEAMAAFGKVNGMVHLKNGTKRSRKYLLEV